MTLDCFPVETAPPHFEVQFNNNQLPHEQLDLNGQCSISFDVGGLIYVVRAKIAEVVSPSRLKLVTVQSFSNIQKREYFRVDTELFVKYRREDEDGAGQPVRARVNLSGGGIRFPVNRRFRVRDRLDVQLFFDQFNKLDARCIGQIVRIDEPESGEIEVALRFVEIKPADRDRIISFCFAQQREVLRRRVQVKPER